MMARDILLSIGEQPSIESYVEQSQLSEECGYDRVWIGESWGRNTVSVLTSIARDSSEIGIGTSILPIFTRTPALIGQTAATLQEVSDGRFRMGIGSSGPRVVEDWHGVAYERPLRRTRETLEIVKQVLEGREVSIDGEFFDLDGFKLRSEPPNPVPCIDAAGMGPKSVELAGRFADGWHATMFTPNGLRSRLEDFRRGNELGDRDLTSQRVTLSLPAAALDDRARARNSVRQHIGFYLGSMGSFYRESLARQGYEDIVEDFYEQWKAGERQSALQGLPDTLIDKLGIAGTPEEARDRLKSFESINGLGSVAVMFPRDASAAEIESTILALAPS